VFKTGNRAAQSTEPRNPSSAFSKRTTYDWKIKRDEHAQEERSQKKTDYPRSQIS
jgi:hypothetical protein